MARARDDARDMINIDSWTEEQVETFSQLVSEGYMDIHGEMTDKGRNQLNSTRSFPILHRSKEKTK